MADEKKVEKKDRGRWFREMRSELKKVVWPDGKTTMKNTLTVLAVSLAIGVVIWVFDAVAINAVSFLINLFQKTPEVVTETADKTAAAVAGLFGRF
jgi:preprotein translocase subunit SecE